MVVIFVSVTGRPIFFNHQMTNFVDGNYYRRSLAYLISFPLKIKTLF